MHSIFIDTDPGIDDALALLFALQSPELSVVGITTVAGNIGLDRTTRNAGRVLAVLERDDIPVVSGAAAPLVRATPTDLGFHGVDGIGGAPLPNPRRAPDGDDAVAWTAARLDAAPTGTHSLFALGPLTNVALLVRDYPRAAKRLARIVCMGGTWREPGNRGLRGEFNFHTDPEAVDVVFRSGIAVTVIPLDVTRRVRASRSDAARLVASSRPAAHFAGLLLETYFVKDAASESRPLHDLCVPMFALRPELFSVERLSLRVGTGPTDESGSLHDGSIPVDVALGVQADAVVQFFCSRLESF